MAKPFELGLVMAGAVSAGAYSAGVIDFLIEALDEYEHARKELRTRAGEAWDGPTHAVRIPVLAGASAGGMTAAIAAIHMFGEFEPFGGGAAPSAKLNRLYASWVDEIDIEHLLALDDISGGEALRSVLSSTALDAIFERTMEPQRPVTRDWVGREGALAVMTTLTNLSGVPYEFELLGPSGGEAYGMLNHGDDLCFLVQRGSTVSKPGYDTLDLDRPSSAVKGRFKAAALATGAFPVGLAARPIGRPFADYLDNPRVGFDRLLRSGQFVFEQIDPKKSVPEGRSSYVAVDGGVVDNEPFELARRYLHGEMAQNPLNRDGEHTSYAVLLVDPFPNRPEWPAPSAADKLTEVVLPLLSSMINQARFKPQELALAVDETVFSRHLVAPEPVRTTEASKRLPIACGALGGFSGFLHRSFRHHDYLLGRRNAQAFLRWHLHLPESNPLFDGWRQGGNLERWAVKDVTEWPRDQYLGPDDDRRMPDKPVLPRAPRNGVAPEPERAFPIIPLTRRMREPVAIEAKDRPRPDDVDVAKLEGLLDARLSRVVTKLIDEDLRDLIAGNWVTGGLKRFALKQALPGMLKTRAMKAITEARDQIAEAFPRR